jgi:hypothetical protein
VNFSDPFGLCPPEWLCVAANFTAGFGDALTFGATDWIRNRVGANDVIDRRSTAYIAGEVAEFAAELALTGGAAALKKAAGGVSGRVARAAARPFVEAVPRGAGEVVHHINPLAGHPGGAATTFPLRGLPAAIHSGRWNLQPLSKSAHASAHLRLRRLDALVGALWDPNAVLLRGILSVERSSP